MGNSANRSEKVRKKRLIPGKLRNEPRVETGHSRRRFRPLWPVTESRTIARKALDSLYPWKFWDYPGKWRLGAWLFGVSSVEYARTVSEKPLPLPRLRALRERLAGKASELQALVAECDGRIAELEARREARLTRQRKRPLVSVVEKVRVLPPEP